MLRTHVAEQVGFSALSFPANLGNMPVEMMENPAPIKVLRGAPGYAMRGR
jgi:hypothetical protein